MSSPSRIGTSLFPLPNGKEVEVIFVELPDGRIVPRTREELEPAQGAPASKEVR